MRTPSRDMSRTHMAPSWHLRLPFHLQLSSPGIKIRKKVENRPPSPAKKRAVTASAAALSAFAFSSRACACHRRRGCAVSAIPDNESQGICRTTPSAPPLGGNSIEHEAGSYRRTPTCHAHLLRFCCCLLICSFLGLDKMVSAATSAKVCAERQTPVTPAGRLCQVPEFEK